MFASTITAYEINPYTSPSFVYLLSGADALICIKYFNKKTRLSKSGGFFYLLKPIDLFR